MTNIIVIVQHQMWNTVTHNSSVNVRHGKQVSLESALEHC